ncbi:MAG: hypothetical protein RSB11_08255, partial [Oscillospiraceae bacterium]
KNFFHEELMMKIISSSFFNKTEAFIIIGAYLSGICQLDSKSAYDMFFYYSPAVASAFGICMINSKDVIQSPKLLKKFSQLTQL